MHSAGFAEAYQTRFEYSMGKRAWANGFEEGNVDYWTNERPPREAEASILNRATSYSPTHLRVQYHRG